MIKKRRNTLLADRIKYFLGCYIRLQWKGIFTCETPLWCGVPDILGYTEREIIEFEIKTSVKNLQDERFKTQHKQYKEDPQNSPNRYYFVIPEGDELLLEETRKLTDELNTSYGILVMNGKGDFHSVKSSHKLHSFISTSAREKINKSLCIKLLNVLAKKAKIPKEDQHKNCASVEEN